MFNIKNKKITLSLFTLIIFWYVVIQVFVLEFLLGFSELEAVTLLSWNENKSFIYIFTGALTNYGILHLSYNISTVLIIGLLLENKINNQKFLAKLIIFFFVSNILIFNFISYSWSSDLSLVGTSTVTNMLTGCFIFVVFNNLKEFNIHDNVEYIIITPVILIYMALETFNFYIFKDPAKFAHLISIVYGFFVLFLLNKLNLFCDFNTRS